MTLISCDFSYNKGRFVVLFVLFCLFGVLYIKNFGSLSLPTSPIGLF